MQSSYFQPTIQIRANSAIIYNKFSGSRNKYDQNGDIISRKLKVQSFEDKEAYSGRLTKGAIKRMSRAINLFVESSIDHKVYSKIYDKNINHRISFITLTIPSHTKVELKEAQKTLLEPLLKHLRQVHGMKSYVWKAEIQKRGQLHYHIISDVYIPHFELKNKWNSLIGKQGYNKEYIAEHGHQNANSTDIHSVKKINDLASYLLKYFTKTEQNEVKMKGKLWDCSLNIKSARYFETDFTADLEFDIYNLEKERKVLIKHKDCFSFVRFGKLKAISVFPRETKQAYFQHLVDIRCNSGTLFESIVISTPEQDTTPLIQVIPSTVPKQTVIKYFLN